MNTKYIISVMAVLLVLLVGSIAGCKAPVDNSAVLKTSYDSGYNSGIASVSSALASADSKYGAMIDELKIANLDLSNQLALKSAEFDDFKAVNEDVIAGKAQDTLVFKLVERKVIKDDDFEDELMEWINAELGVNIEDTEDMIISIKSNYISWGDSSKEADNREDGQCEVETILKVKYFENGDDDREHTVRVRVITSIDDEELKSIDGYEIRSR